MRSYFYDEDKKEIGHFDIQDIDFRFNDLVPEFWIDPEGEKRLLRIMIKSKIKSKEEHV